ncbi:MAG: hypothetical protein NTW32_05065 [Chloroflexi bacterium]|nr:hypothetical protein [Chloroflexota bacterium]
MFAHHLRPLYSVIALFLTLLACSMPGAVPQVPSAIPVDATKIALEILATQNAPRPAPVVDATKIALEIQATNNAPVPAQLVDATKVALEIQATNNAPAPAQLVDATKVALEVLATNASAQLTQQAGQLVQPQSPATEVPTRDVQARIKNAKILVYEDTQDIGLWISDALNGMGLKYTHVGDAIGHLMENLNSPVQWDLIIIGAESKSKVQGEFWDVIGEKIARDKTALVAEVWYLDRIGEGKIKPVLANCGIEYQRNWELADSIYWLDSAHPIFSDPNNAMPLINYTRYWPFQAGDLIRISPGSNATLLAGIFQKQKSDYGVMATCLEGRVVFQTFSNHDYHQDAIIRLWQNYITYTLKNHFAVMP